MTHLVEQETDSREQHANWQAPETGRQQRQEKRGDERIVRLKARLHKIREQIQSQQMYLGDMYSGSDKMRSDLKMLGERAPENMRKQFEWVISSREQGARIIESIGYLESGLDRDPRVVDNIERQLDAASKTEDLLNIRPYITH